MAGRGTDIVLGGGDIEERDKVAALGGLFVLGTNRHESRRIGRSAPEARWAAGAIRGSSRFFICLEDDLIQRYGVMSLIPARPQTDAAVGLRRGSHRVTRDCARQRIVEGQNFEIRRTLWKCIRARRRATTHRLRLAAVACGG
mgnify:CR=1 FL=1